jgi:curli biogenesis system outer membrane secretion channel CsgG
MRSHKRWVFALALIAMFLGTMSTPVFSADKPRVAVIEFKAKADNQWYQWWRSGGATAVQDVLVTELVKSGKFRVIEREALAALMAEKNLALSGDLDPATAVQAGKLLGVKYLLTGAITEYGASDAEAGARSIGGLPSFRVKRSKFAVAMNARLIDAETGEIVWADEARQETKSAKVNVSGIGGGVDDDAQFDRVLKPTVQDLVASLRAADI